MGAVFLKFCLDGSELPYSTVYTGHLRRQLGNVCVSLGNDGIDKWDILKTWDDIDSTKL